jgi:hypothetical protein
VERGQRFWDLTGSHIQHCNGSAFIMNKGKPFKMTVNSRVAVDAAFFYEMQQNYSRPTIRNILAKEKSGISIIDMDSPFSEDRNRKKE